MKKTVLALMLALALILPYVTPAYAYDEKKHNEFMEKVLFGDSKPQNDEALKMIESASYLAMDQYNESIQSNKGKIALNYLMSKSVHGFPTSISAIDFHGNQFHRSHTHRGWDFTLYKRYPEDTAHWKTRKNILLAVVNKVFDFRFFSGSWLGKDLGYDKRCNSLSALIYYIHVLGDHIADEEKRKLAGADYKATDIMMPLVRDHPGDDNPDIIWELQKHLKVLFSSHTDERVYKSMMGDMNALREEAGALSASTAGLSSNAYAGKLMGILETNVPILLKKEYFFLKVFYPDRVTKQ